MVQFGGRWDCLTRNCNLLKKLTPSAKQRALFISDDFGLCSDQMVPDCILDQFSIALGVQYFHDAVFVKGHGASCDV